MGVAIKLNGGRSRCGSRRVAVLIGDQDVGIVLSTVEKHADNRLVVGADLSGRYATSGVRNMMECVKRGQTASYGHAGRGFEEVTALLKIFEIHDGVRLALNLEFGKVHGEPQRTFDTITLSLLPRRNRRVVGADLCGRRWIARQNWSGYNGERGVERNG